MFHTKLITDKLLRHPDIIWYDCSVRLVCVCVKYLLIHLFHCVDDDDDVDVAYAFLMRWTRSIVVAIILSHLITLNLVFRSLCSFLLSFCWHFLFFSFQCVFFLHQRRSHITLHGYCCPLHAQHRVHFVNVCSAYFSVHRVSFRILFGFASWCWW